MAKGINLSDDIVDSTMAYFQRFKHELVSSVQRDLEAGNPIEVGVLNGSIASSGKDVGVPTPVNDLIVACLAVADNRARSRLGSASSA